MRQIDMSFYILLLDYVTQLKSKLKDLACITIYAIIQSLSHVTENLVHAARAKHSDYVHGLYMHCGGQIMIQQLFFPCRCQHTLIT